MSIKKKSQHQLGPEDLDGVNISSDEPVELPVGQMKLPIMEPPIEPPMEFFEEDEFMVEDDNYVDGEGVVFEVSEDQQPQVFKFDLPKVPGGEKQEEIEPAEIEVTENDDIQVESDPWSWTIGSFLQWLSDRMNAIPRHSGRDSAGLERAMSYLEALDREISKAVRSDINGEIDVAEVEKARTSIYEGIERLQKRLEVIQDKIRPKRKQKKKKADDDNDMVKEAQKTTHVGGIVVTVPLLISSIARTCINSMVSAGRDIEDVFDKLAKKYDLTPREEMETMQLLSDMGYAMRRSSGYLRDEEVDYTSPDNFDWMQNFPG